MQRPPETRILPRSSASGALFFRDMSCRLTNHQDGTQNAHLCPRSEDNWFHKNGMTRYILDSRNSGLRAVDDLNNLILLRSDIHSAFDQRRVVFVPKASRLVAHVLTHPSAELVQLYHNVALHPIKGVPLEFFLARVAWTIFPFIEGFLLCGVSRRVLVDDATYERELSADECTLLIKPTEPKSRSASPKKRGRSEAEEEADVETLSAGQESSSLSCPMRKRSRQERTRTFATECSLSHTRLDRSCFRTMLPSNTPISSAASTSGGINGGLTTIHHGDSNDDDSSDTATEHTEEFDRLAHLRADRLREERLRSDPNGSWLKELEWAQTALHRTMTADEMYRFHEAMGADVLLEP